MIGSSKGLAHMALGYYLLKLKRVRQEMNARTGGKDGIIGGYAEAYEKELVGIKKESGFDDIVKDSLRSDITLFGDFATEGWPKREFLKMLDSLYKRSKEICIAIDRVPYECRGILEKYVKGELGKKGFLKKLKPDSLGQLPFWDDYFKVMDFAKSKGLPILPLDFRGITEKSIFKKDYLTAKRLYRYLGEHRGYKLLALLPDTWLAKNHLPECLNRIFLETGANPKIVRVFTGSEKVFVRLARDLREDNVRLVSCGDLTYAYNMIHPVARYNAFFNYLDGEQEISSHEKRKEGFKDVLKRINSNLKLGMKIESLSYRLYSDFELAFIKRILSASFLKETQRRKILDYVIGAESYFVPYSQIIYLNNLGMLHASEEAGHYLRYVMAGLERPKSREDRFYISVLNEAAAFVASKSIVKGRMPVENDRAMLAMKSDIPEEERENIMIHSLGYALGDRLFKKFKRGQIGTGKIRELFSKRFRLKGEARKYYDSLSEIAMGK